MNGFHLVGWLVAGIPTAVAVVLLANSTSSYGGAPAQLIVSLIGGGLAASLIPFGFGFVVARLDTLVEQGKALEHLKHLQRLDPELREKLDAAGSCPSAWCN